MAKKKWHVVIVGTEPGIYETWYVQPSFQMPELSPASDGHAREDLTEANRAEAGPKVIGVPGNIYESYKTPQAFRRPAKHICEANLHKCVRVSAVNSCASPRSLDIWYTNPTDRSRNTREH